MKHATTNVLLTSFTGIVSILSDHWCDWSLGFLSTDSHSQIPVCSLHRQRRQPGQGRIKRSLEHSWATCCFTGPDRLLVPLSFEPYCLRVGFHQECTRVQPPVGGGRLGLLSQRHRSWGQDVICHCPHQTLQSLPSEAQCMLGSDEGCVITVTLMRRYLQVVLIISGEGT